GWPLEMIGAVFGQHKGCVSRRLKKVKQDLRECFEQSPDWLCMEQPTSKQEQANIENDGDKNNAN
ncbi:MAG: hypothetical protein JKY95_08510, partial [Planctomycetaceae bacterium]|nr:hypothetical protein [Planctomycetaceae bacterium]